MAEKRRWWQHNPEKVSANVEEAKNFLDAARHGPAGKALRPFHPDHYAETTPGQGDPGDVPHSSVAARLRELQTLLDQGLITPQDFEARKDQILREV
jgi:hypothetical protein